MSGCEWHSIGGKVPGCGACFPPPDYTPEDEAAARDLWQKIPAACFTHPIGMADIAVKALARFHASARSQGREAAWTAGRDAVVGHLRYRADAYRGYQNEHASLAVKYLEEAIGYAQGITPPAKLAEPSR